MSVVVRFLRMDSETGESNDHDGGEPETPANTALTPSPLRRDVSNDNSDEWADPPGVDGDDEQTPLIGPLTLPDLVFGVHAVIAAVLVPFVWNAFQAGNFPLVGSLGLLIGLLLVTGVTMRRIAARR
jgi:hypothetical protein